MPAGPHLHTAPLRVAPSRTLVCTCSRHPACACTLQVLISPVRVQTCKLVLARAQVWGRAPVSLSARAAVRSHALWHTPVQGAPCSSFHMSSCALGVLQPLVPRCGHAECADTQGCVSLWSGREEGPRGRPVWAGVRGWAGDSPSPGRALHRAWGQGSRVMPCPHRVLGKPGEEGPRVDWRKVCRWRVWLVWREHAFRAGPIVLTVAGGGGGGEARTLRGREVTGSK